MYTTIIRRGIKYPIIISDKYKLERFSDILPNSIAFLSNNGIDIANHAIKPVDTVNTTGNKS